MWAIMQAFTVVSVTLKYLQPFIGGICVLCILKHLLFDHVSKMSIAARNDVQPKLNFII